MNLKKNILRNIPFIQVIKMGTAEVLEESETGIFVWKKLGKSHMIVNDNLDEAREWIIKHESDEGREYDLTEVFSHELADFMKDRYGLLEGMECYQGVWIKDHAPKLKGNLDIRVATEVDIPFISKYYDEWDDGWGTELVKIGNVFIGRSEGTDIGFAGQHLEGALGLVYVLPEYRMKGFALELESFMIGEMMNRGLTPYGHVIVGNEKSMKLQEKMGFDFWDDTMHWLMKEVPWENSFE